MAIPTSYDIKFACGHKETRDLSDKPAGKRNGFASWLSRQICSKCYKKQNAEEYFAEQRQKIEDNRKIFNLPEFTGSEKQVDFANTARNRLITAALEDFVRGDNPSMSEEEFDEQVLGLARQQTYPSWWIDNKDIESEDLIECLETSLEDENFIPEENPFQ